LFRAGTGLLGGDEPSIARPGFREDRIVAEAFRGRSGSVSRLRDKAVCRVWSGAWCRSTASAAARTTA